MIGRTLGPRWGRSAFVLGTTAVTAMGVAAFALDLAIPLLVWVDRTSHAAGHLLFQWAPTPVEALAGSTFHVAVPLLLAISFLLRERDVLGSSLCFAWAATAFEDIGAYMADASSQRLEYFGADHDWAYLFSRVGLLDRADAFAAIATGVGLACLGVAAFLAVQGHRLQPFVRDGAWPTRSPFPLPTPLPDELADLDLGARLARIGEAEQELEQQRLEAGLPSPASGAPLGTPLAQLDVEPLGADYDPLPSSSGEAPDQEPRVVDLAAVEFFSET